ncbi:MAG TPA: hypothetical protein VH280_17555 [Verrucomicrobiae bacterium]|nr:hypothetical protein [Verrucomicrobiae bacterium]
MGVISAVCKEMADKIFAPTTPTMATLNAKPSFLLKEIEKDYLAEQFLCKIIAFNAALGEVHTDLGRGVEKRSQGISRLFIHIFVLVVKLFGDLFDAEGGFQLRGCGIDFLRLEQFKKLLLRCMAMFILADKVAVTPCRCKLDAFGDETEVGFLKCVVQFYERKAPVIFSWRNKRGHDGGFALTVAGGEIVGNEVAKCHTATCQRGIFSQVDYQHVHNLASRIGICADASEVVHIVLERRLFQSPSLFFIFVKVVNEVADEVKESGVVEFLPESLNNRFAGQFEIHTWLIRNDDRMTSRGAST